MAWYRFICAAFLGVACLLMTVHAQQSGTSLTASPKSAANAKSDAERIELERVERLVAARREYQLALEQLRGHYAKHGELEKAKWAEEELILFHRIPKQAFVLDLHVPPPTLKAAQNIPEANELFKRAMTYKDKGWMGNEYIDNQRRAELLFQQILTNYPESNKIGDVAYQLGDLYESKAYRQYRLAAMYFERCFQWNPNTQSDARLRAARLYDKHLAERTRAMELYRDVTTHDVDPKREAEAQKRLTEMSGKK